MRYLPLLALLLTGVLVGAGWFLWQGQPRPAGQIAEITTTTASGVMTTTTQSRDVSLSEKQRAAFVLLARGTDRDKLPADYDVALDDLGEEIDKATGKFGGGLRVLGAIATLRLAHSRKNLEIARIAYNPKLLSEWEKCAAGPPCTSPQTRCAFDLIGCIVKYERPRRWGDVVAAQESCNGVLASGCADAAAASKKPHAR